MTKTTPSDLLSLREVSVLLGVSREDVKNARRRGGRIPRLGAFVLPEPWATVDGFPIWRKSQFRDFLISGPLALDRALMK